MVTQQDSPGGLYPDPSPIAKAFLSIQQGEFNAAEYLFPHSTLLSKTAFTSAISLDPQHSLLRTDGSTEPAESIAASGASLYHPTILLKHAFLSVRSLEPNKKPFSHAEGI